MGVALSFAPQTVEERFSSLQVFCGAFPSSDFAAFAPEGSAYNVRVAAEMDIYPTFSAMVFVTPSVASRIRIGSYGLMRAPRD